MTKDTSIEEQDLYDTSVRKNKLTMIKSEIDDVAYSLPIILENIGDELQSLNTEEKYLEYVLFGSQLIEYVLHHLIKNMNHCVNLTLIATEIVSKSTSPYHTNYTANDSDSLGKKIEILRDRYKLKGKDKLINDLTVLVENRNRVSHKLIADYKGDIFKASNDLKSYVVSLPVEKIFQQMISLQEEITKDTRKRLKIADGLKFGE